MPPPRDPRPSRYTGDQLRSAVVRILQHHGSVSMSDEGRAPHGCASSRTDGSSRRRSTRRRPGPAGLGDDLGPQRLPLDARPRRQPAEIGVVSSFPRPAGPGRNRRRFIFSPPRRTVAIACLSPSVLPAGSAAGPSGAGPDHRFHRGRNRPTTRARARSPNPRRRRRDRPVIIPTIPPNRHGKFFPLISFFANRGYNYNAMARGGAGRSQATKPGTEVRTTADDRHRDPAGSRRDQSPERA